MMETLRYVDTGQIPETKPVGVTLTSRSLAGHSFSDGNTVAKVAYAKSMFSSCQRPDGLS